MIFVCRKLHDADEGIYIEKDRLLHPQLVLRTGRRWLTGVLEYSFAAVPTGCGGWLDCSDATEGSPITVTVLKSRSNKAEYAELRKKAEKNELHP